MTESPRLRHRNNIYFFRKEFMAKSQINNMSKREILESLMYEQTQSNATLSRLITAVARTSNLDPLKLAEAFIDDKGNQEFIDTFNLQVKAQHAQAHASETADITGESEQPQADGENAE